MKDMDFVLKYNNPTNHWTLTFIDGEDNINLLTGNTLIQCFKEAFELVKGLTRDMRVEFTDITIHCEEKNNGRAN